MIWQGMARLSMQFQTFKNMGKKCHLFIKLTHSNEVNVFLEHSGIYYSTLKLSTCQKIVLTILWLKFYGNPIGEFSPLGSTIVVMKTSSTSSTSLLEPTSFHKTTFQPGFFKFLEKNSCIIWLGNMKSSNVIGSLC